MTIQRIKIISGGQTGADQGALEAAEALDIPRGGWMPRGWRTEDGPRPEFKERFNMQETISADYRPRTQLNVREADATLWIGDDTSPGGRLTCNEAFWQSKGLYICRHWRGEILQNDMEILYIREFLRDNRVSVLNVAGNRERKRPGIQAFTKALLIAVLSTGALPHNAPQAQGESKT